MKDAWVPAVRYLMLGIVAAAVGVTEGAAGASGLIVLLLLGWGVLATFLSWLLAHAIASLLSRFPKRQALAATVVILGAALIWALFFEPYYTPFGRAIRGGLLQVLS